MSKFVFAIFNRASKMRGTNARYVRTYMYEIQGAAATWPKSRGGIQLEATCFVDVAKIIYFGSAEYIRRKRRIYILTVRRTISIFRVFLYCPKDDVEF